MTDNHKVLELKNFIYRLYHEDKRKLIVIWGKNLHKRLWKQEPMPLITAFLLSKFASESKKTDGLFVKDDLKQNCDVNIENLKLSRFFENKVLGEWSLDVETINYLEKDIKSLRPKIILEFGSGISTLCLAQFLIEMHGTEPLIRIYSVEQDEEYAKTSERLIREYGYEKYVKIIYAPLTKIAVEGVNCYTYDFERVGELLNGVHFEYCLIDGPSVTEFDGRFATLPLVRKYLSNHHARFVLDDALRAKELVIAKMWNRLSYVDVQGIVITRKGLLTGFVRNKSSKVG